MSSTLSTSPTPTTPCGPSGIGTWPSRGSRRSRRCPGPLVLGGRRRGGRPLHRGASRRRRSIPTTTGAANLARLSARRREALERRLAGTARTERRAPRGQGPLPVPRCGWRSRGQTSGEASPDYRAAPTAYRPADLRSQPSAGFADRSADRVIVNPAVCRVAVKPREHRYLRHQEHSENSI